MGAAYPVKSSIPPAENPGIDPQVNMGSGTMTKQPAGRFRLEYAADPRDNEGFDSYNRSGGHTI